MLISASQSSSELCKTLLGAAVLGYSTPTVVGWHSKSNDKHVDANFTKISGVYNYTQALPSSRDEDLVLLVDGSDTWMQLRAQTLLERYYDINKRADQRIGKQLGKIATTRNVRQDIVFSSQKHCPSPMKDPACYALPQSPLPADIYGSKTDAEGSDEQESSGIYRPRFLSSGVIIGTVSGMRALFTEAQARMQKGSAAANEDQLFSQIFGDQELHRELLRQQGFTNQVKGGNANRFNPEHLQSIRGRLSIGDANHDLDFGIGLDYSSEISLGTSAAVIEAEWLKFSTTDQIKHAEETRGITTSRLQQLPADITDTVPPFWTFTEEPIPRHINWDNVTLLTNIYTGVTPALIQHSAAKTHLGAHTKSFRKTWWDRIWYQPYGRAMLNALIYNPVVPIGVAGYDETTRRVFWSPEMWKGGARVETGNHTHEAPWLRYEWELCPGTEGEVFRDKKGSWHLPVDH